MSQPWASSSAPSSQRGSKRSSSPTAPAPQDSRKRSKANKAERMKVAVTQALKILQTLSRLAKEATSDMGVPGLAAGLTVLSTILEKMQQMSTNIESIITLRERLEGLERVLKEFISNSGDGKLPVYMEERIDRLAKCWADIYGDVGTVENRNRFLRFIKSEADSQRLGELLAQINASINDFLMESALHVEVNVHQIHDGMQQMQQGVGAVDEHVQEVHAGVMSVQSGIQDVQSEAGRLYHSLDSVRRTVKMVVAQQDDRILPRSAQRAQYDANSARKPCLPGTRIAVFSRLRHWIIIACTQKQVLGQIYWINGLAGTGKTSIAFSIAVECENNGRLGGNFFCSRFDAECSDPNFIFVTLSRQLCRSHKAFQQKVAAILKDNPDIVSAGPSRQLEELIVRPLEAVRDTFPTFVIVIDALDECRDENDTSTILLALAKFINRLSPLLFIITSRPERRITALFDQSREKTLREVTTPLALHEIHLESALDDVKHYFSHSFSEIRQFYSVPEKWPSTRDIDALTERSRGLFIYASTAIRFIKDIDASDPEGQLELLLSKEAASGESGPLLSSLYTQVINTTYSKISQSLATRLRAILGTISLARVALSAATLAGLLGLKESVILNALTGLRAVLHIPENHSEAIHVIHPTFLEFLLEPSLFESKPDAFVIEPLEQHLRLFSQCLESMRGLKEDILGLGNPVISKEGIPTLRDRVEANIPSHLRYSCRYWSIHLAGAMGSPSTEEYFAALAEFLQDRLLHWCEASSWLGILDETVLALNAARRACQSLGGSFVDLMPLLHEFRRFVYAYSACIDRTPLQLYHGLLAITPPQSPILTTYANRRKPSLKVRRGMLQTWDPCLDTYTSRDGAEIRCVTFSPDGAFFATGGSDSTIRIWRTVTRSQVSTIEVAGAHGNAGVQALAYSPNGAHIVAATTDKTLRIWDATSGYPVSALSARDCESYCTTFVAYSTCGRFLLSVGGGPRATVKLWDLSSARCLLSLDTDNSIKQAGISADSSVIAYCAGSDLCLHTTASNSRERLSIPGSGIAATFSTDNRYLAAATRHAIRIWSLPDRLLKWSISTEYPLTSRLVFSNNSNRVCCGTHNGFSVRLFSLDSDTLTDELVGHESPVSDIAGSPTDSQMVSISTDGVMRIWDSDSKASYRIPPDSPHTAHADHPTPHGSHTRLAVFRSLVDGTNVLWPIVAHGAEHIANILDELDIARSVELHVDMVKAWNEVLLRRTESRGGTRRELPTMAHEWALRSQWAFLTGQPLTDPCTPAITSINGDFMACLSFSNHSSNTLRIYDLQAGNAVATSEGSWEKLSTFSPDGTLIYQGFCWTKTLFFMRKGSRRRGRPWLP